MEDINFYRSAPCQNHLNDILFERKALDFSAAKFKQGCIPSALCWLFTTNSSTTSTTVVGKQWTHRTYTSQPSMLFVA